MADLGPRREFSQETVRRVLETLDQEDDLDGEQVAGRARLPLGETLKCLSCLVQAGRVRRLPPEWLKPARYRLVRQE